MCENVSTWWATEGKRNPLGPLGETSEEAKKEKEDLVGKELLGWEESEYIPNCSLSYRGTKKKRERREMDTIKVFSCGRGRKKKKERQRGTGTNWAEGRNKVPIMKVGEVLWHKFKGHSRD